MRRLWVGVSVAFALVAAVPTVAEAVPLPAATTRTRVIVTMESAGAAHELRERHTGSRRVGRRAVALRAPAAELDALRADADVIRVERDVPVHATLTFNDPCLVQCGGGTAWHLARIHAPAAWDRTGGAGITIGILDTGVDPSHRELAGKLAGPELDLTGLADGAGDHGTAVAGVAVAVAGNAFGTAGVARDARFLSIKVLDRDGGGYTSTVADGIYAAVDRGAEVVNLSLSAEGASQALADAVAYAVGRGVVVVAAAGNEGSTAPRYPASLPGVIGVAASTTGDRLADFSNRGDWLDLAAPGTGIPTAAPGGQLALVTGTSAAAPIVAGTAALLLADGTPPGAVEAALRAASVPLADGSGMRRLDAAAAMDALRAFGGFTGGVRVAMGDIDGVPGSELVVSAGPGGGPHVRVLRKDGTALSGFMAYAPAFGGGIDVAAGDVDGDGRAEIVTGAGPGGGPHVRVLRADGSELAGFYAYDPRFTNGIHVAVADIDGDGKGEIITGAGPGGGPHVRVFSAGGVPRDGGFFAYAPSFPGGVDVAGGDLDGDGKAEVVTGPGTGGGPHVRTFSGTGAPLGGGFFAYDPRFAGGVRVGVGDGDGDGTLDVIAGAGPGGGPHVRALRPDGRETRAWLAFAMWSTGGTDVAGARDGVVAGSLTGDCRIVVL